MIRWFANNPVAANLMMVFILVWGWYNLKHKIPLEVFPDFEYDIINIKATLRGGQPTDLEKSVVLRIEEAVFDLQGIDGVYSTASEGSATVRLEVESDTDARELLEDVKNRVDSINTFPSDMEKPSISIAQRRREVISVAITGNKSEKELRRLGEDIRDEISRLPGLTHVELGLVRPFEISISIPKHTLEKYGLSLQEVSTAIRKSSLDLSGGTLKTQAGQIRIHSRHQAYEGKDFENITIRTRNDGARLSLKEIAEIDDGFEETAVAAYFDGKPCVVIEVYRVGKQNAMTIAQQVKDYVKGKAQVMPEGVEIYPWRDWSRIVKSRLNTLLKSAFQGCFLVLLILALFLKPSLAFWVCIGIPVAMTGSLILMPFFGVTLNVFTLFAFILVLGVVVDDAIVTGENIYSHVQRGTNPVEAVVSGTREVAVPVTFGILTTMAAFLPLMMIESRRAAFFQNIPLVVVPVLAFSLIESKLILPSHLRHLKTGIPTSGLLKLQQKIASGLETFIERVYQPALAGMLAYRYTFLALFMAVWVVLSSLIYAGHISFRYRSRIPSETVRASLVMPEGTPQEVTRKHVLHMNAKAEILKQKYVDPSSGQSVIKHILATIGTSRFGREQGRTHVGRVMFQLVSPEQRKINITSMELSHEWRKLIGKIPGAKELSMRAEIGRGGNPVDIQLAGKDLDRLKEASVLVRKELEQYPDLFDITDTFEGGKSEVQLILKPGAEQRGIRIDEIIRQVRQSVFGLQSQRIQRGREDIRVMIRYPRGDRGSLYDLKKLMIQLPQGSWVPLEEIADFEMRESLTRITRRDRMRTINILADADKSTADIQGIRAKLDESIPELLSDYPDIYVSMEGEAREQKETFSSLTVGGLLLLLAIYAMLAIPFKSYLQPLIVMSVIPFGIIGAILGHLLMGKILTLMSVFGLLALAGVVVNDSLVLVDYINKRRKEGMDIVEAARKGGVARFRAIMLTSLTTFAGLIPLIWEKSTQAQFLIPMAISLGFGILFATLITLFLVPINYLILEDFKKAMVLMWPQEKKSS